jgi:hypothetical protein
VSNATDLGPGGAGSSGTQGDGIYSQGGRGYDNNLQMDGLEINDLVSGSPASTAVANPDTIQEFKVQTGQFDAAFGRNAGANVNLVTKTGSNQFHGTAFEFFRNRDLNANDFFFNANGQPRPVLGQNQFGGTIGGPIKKDKLFFFGSYQGTRQANGFASGCSSTVFLPPFTDDRSAAAIGAIYAGQRGYFQNLFGGVGPAVAADGSNISPIALALLQAKLPNGNYLIPTPQRINPAQPDTDIQGSSSFSSPCVYNENQYMANGQYIQNSKSQFTVRFFELGESSKSPFFGGSSSVPSNVPGSASVGQGSAVNASISHTYNISSSLFNVAQVAYIRETSGGTSTDSLGSYSNWNITAPVLDVVPSIYAGDMELGSGGADSTIVNHYIFQDSLAWAHGKHSFRFGGGVERLQYNHPGLTFPSLVDFETWPDFLMGLNAIDNGTEAYSDVLGTFDLLGQFGREWRIWDGHAFIQDDIRVSSRLTVNIGLRYEHIGDFADATGRNSTFDLSLADPNPPITGSVAGYVVGSNYKGPPLPAGVKQENNEFAIKGLGQNHIAPRLGLAWQVFHDPGTLVLRAGYGMFNTRPEGFISFQQITGPPYSELRDCFVTCNPLATLASPFLLPAPGPGDFPIFPAYSAVTALSINAVDQNFQPSTVQEWSLNAQTQFHSYLFELGYVGTRGTKLFRTRDLDQANLASAADPIRGETTNTLANLGLRTPLLGWATVFDAQSAGASWYNALEASLTKRFGHGLTFLASYTWSRALDTDAPAADQFGIGVTPGNQDSNSAAYGRSAFNRSQRAIFSYVYDLPGPANKEGFVGHALGGWSVSGVTTFQTGLPISILGVNANNVYGVNSFTVPDFAQIAPGCTASSLVTHGSVSSKVGGYFNTSCVGPGVPWPIVGDDGIATGFGDSGPGIVNGPAQVNFDMGIIKKTQIREQLNAEFRAEFFNIFNHPQFLNPDSNVSDPTFGLISGTSVSPRVIQFALKLNF